MAMNQVQFQKGLSMQQFEQRYGSEQQCEQAVRSWRWPAGFRCPRCGHSECSEFRRGTLLYMQCSACRHQCSLIAGTIFERSKLPLKKWFLAMHLLSKAKTNVSALELKRDLGLCYRSAWLVKHKLMQVMLLREEGRKLSGRVEIDDSYLGGQRVGGKPGRGSENKVPFVAAVQTTEDGKAELVCLSLGPFTNESMLEFASRSLVRPLTGMQYFKQEERTVCDDGCVRVDHSSYSARPVAIGVKVLVRIFERRIEIRELANGQLVRTHERAERPGTVVMPQAERVFNPSRETRFILKQADEIGPQAARLCRMLFGIEGRVGQRKLHGIVNLSRRYPNRFVDAACAAAIEQGIHSYKHVKALTERLVAEALAAIDAAGDVCSDGADPGRADLAQEHALIRDTEEYGSLFNLAATQAGGNASVTGGGL